MGFPGQEHWSGLPFPPSRDLPDPGIEPTSPVAPALAGRFFTTAVAVQSPSLVWLFGTPGTAAHQTVLPFTISRNLPKFMSIESAMPFNRLILCHPLLHWAIPIKRIQWWCWSNVIICILKCGKLRDGPQRYITSSPGSWGCYFLWLRGLS